MKAEAITEAKVRFERAEQAAVRLQQMDLDFAGQESAWWAFLLAANGVYAKLKVGARGDAKSEPWFGGREHERRSDPLLQYIHQARNAEEHGLAPATKRTGLSAIAIKGARVVLDKDGNLIEIKAQAGVPMSVQLIPPAIKLVTVHDSLHGNSFDPPTMHVGNSLADTSPAAVAKIALAYLSSLIAKAETFVR